MSWVFDNIEEDGCQLTIECSDDGDESVIEEA